MYRTLIVSLLALLSLSAPLSATVIYVSGDQTGTWSADTVIVTNEVRVPPGQSLIIMPGVEVLFSVYCKLIVDSAAILRAVGTPADSIRFDVLPPNVNWHGVRFLSASDSSRLEYCLLTHGYAHGLGDDSNGGAIYCFGSSPIINHSTISENLAEYGGGIFCGGVRSISPTISHNAINANTGGGIFCGNGGLVSLSPTISYNIISGNTGGGISCEGGTISHNTISGNIGGGIFCVGGTVSHNTISGNTGGGIECLGNTIINYNIISENSAGIGGGICCDDGSSPTISGNTISENSAGFDGGGIFCVYSNPIITDNTISGNRSEGEGGGGIYCDDSNPTISGNIISGNYAFGGAGGGIFCENSSPTISGNTIIGNSTIFGAGGGIFCENSSPSISGNTISGNSAGFGYGGGIFCQNSNPAISSNIISGNSGYTGGGGIYCDDSNPTISGNTIIENSGVVGYGGGICCWNNSNPSIIGNTISENSAWYCGGFYCFLSSPELINCILWDNGEEIGGSPIVTYSNIEGGYAGTGNINIYPAFVDTAQGDYRLQWGSPCIDTGDPNPTYNDPDGTRADMGAWYYDQSLPVRILLTPYNAPIQIPPEGGSFQYAIQATNIATSTLQVSLWCDITLPTGSTTAPVLGPVRISLGSGQTISRLRTQNISAHAPAGLYHYNAYAVAEGDTSEDNFVFTKLGGDGWDLGAGGWTNTGEEFVGEMPSVASIHPSSFILHPCAPNPFNATAALRYQLPVAGHVGLTVYDTAGRLVTTLVNGWRDAGNHQITFDGSELPSGIYFAKLEAGDHSQVQKLVLMK